MSAEDVQALGHDMTVSADAVVTIVGFARTLRAAGVAASPDRVQRLVQALQALDPRRREHVYWAGRLTLCGCLEDLERYDRAFDAYFAGQAPHRRPRPQQTPGHVPVSLDVSAADRPAAGQQDNDDALSLASAASTAERLRHRDFAALSRSERDEISRLLARLRLPGELRRTRRFRPAHRGSIDQGATVRELLRAGGEPARLRHRAIRRRPRRVVLLVDVSGSMSLYAGALLRFAHATARRAVGPTEVFTIGTRLTWVTRELSHRDPDAAMAAVSGSVPDFSGGTRLGGLLKEFLDRWGQRGMARGAVAAILSDGWERGDARLLAEQMARLSRLAHRVVWSNPRKARPGYAPLAAGMAAALPYVDDFVEGHSLAALEHLAAVVAGAAGTKGDSGA
ncbi:MAG: VWA domain-containing protein [Nitriliruptorales bacterium]|nr:VWA domain-containing protein [Nitriliruptorales bacterium]